jgi:4-nitrophenyl phosphatase
MTFPYDLICFDNDGTLSISGEPIGDIVPRLMKLRGTSGTRLMMITNNSSKDDRTYQARMEKMGFAPGSLEIITPVAVATSVFKARQYSRGYILGNELCLAEFARRGIVQDEKKPEFVLVCYDTSLTYEKLVLACALVKSGVPLYQSHIDPLCPGLDGDLPDCGMMIELVSVPTGVRPLMTFGKESENYTKYIAERVRPNEKAVIVGDRLKTDIAAGNRLGWDSVWVNKTSLPVTDGIKPTFIHPTFTDFLARFGA